MGQKAALTLVIAWLIAIAPAVAHAQSPAPAKAADANGFRIGDVVEINTGFGWMNATILTAKDNVYRVRSEIGVDITKTYPDELRRIGPPPGKGPAATTPKAASSGVPPRGFTSCAGKIEGRYATTGGFGSMTIIFRSSGKAFIRNELGELETEVECWTGGGQIILHKPGESTDMRLDINDDGSLQAPFGELKRKGPAPK
jgi:hypothetical protein